MGTDIHVVVQRRRQTMSSCDDTGIILSVEHGEKEWETIPLRHWYDQPNDGSTSFKREGRPLAAGEVDAPQVLRARNYDLFGMLADVRNGRGFAGIETGEGWKPLAADRGLPPDFQYNDNGDDDGWLGDHSFTWCTLRELLDYDWDQQTTQYGVITIDQYDTWDRVSAVYPNSGGVSGRGVITIEQDAWERMGKDTQEQLRHAYRRDGAWRHGLHIRIKWVEMARQAAGAFVDEVLPWLGQFGAPEDVRLVMGFDS